jgi:hypothetical protein
MRGAQGDPMNSEDAHAEAARLALARNMPLYWRGDDEGTRELVDRENRTLGQVRRELQLARTLSRQLVVIGSQFETLTPGRLYGPGPMRRLMATVDTLEKLSYVTT